MSQSVDDDPLALALAPPPNETTEEREVRLRAEAQARKVSEQIDEQLRVERAALKKKRPVKVLLLGQGESGKSTTLKNFQLTYSPKAWAEERASWRMVIQFNLVRNVNTIVDFLSEESAKGDNPLPPPSATDSDITDDEAESSVTRRSGSPLRFTDQHSLLKLRLAPLRQLQKDLEDCLGASSGEDTDDSQGVTYGKRTKHQEAFVRVNNAWKLNARSHDRVNQDVSRRNRESRAREATDIIAECADDMRAIWEDLTVQQMLRKRRLMMEAMSGFFLGDVDRIAQRDYEPSDDDIVRARLRTLGVQEYSIHFEIGPAAGSEWYLYDVGGSRTQRAAWFPYFDDCSAIIFLAPINCFDERLAEDRKVNRLEDSYVLWRLVCSSKLLMHTQIILFLNKCDLLDQKLRSGVRVKDYVRTFGDRRNDMETASKYFSQHFKEILKRNSPVPRPFRVHMTSVIDTKATAETLGVVEEGILRAHLQAVDLI